MIIEANGIRLNAHVDGSCLRYVVESQTPKATNVLRALGVVVDDESGFSLRTNNYPSYNKKLKRFFVRGDNKDGNNSTVEITFKSHALAVQACSALERLVSKVELPDGTDPGHGEVSYAPGGTSGVRFAIVTRSQANKLSLTGKKLYPENRFWKIAQPVVTINRHYNEHIAQAVDVLNKAHQEVVEDKTKGVINPHKVTPKQAKQARDAVRELFDKAERDDYLIALWRLVTGIRGPDFVDPEPE